MSVVIRRVTKKLLARIPYGLEAALQFRQCFFRLPPSLRPGEAFLSWLKEVENSQGCLEGFPDRRVLFFSYSNPWIGISLATACVLVGRGCRIDFVFPTYTQFDREDRLQERKYFRAILFRFLKNGRHPRLRLIDLSRIRPEPLSPPMVDQARAQSLLDSKYLLRREEIDIEQDSHHQKVFEFRLRRNLDSMARLLSLIRKEHYDLLLTPNGGSMEWGAAFRLAQLTGLTPVSFEFGDHRGTIWISRGVPSSSIDTAQEWQESASLPLTPQERQRIAQIAAMRQGAEWQDFIWAPQRIPPQHDRQALLAQLRLPENGEHPIVLLTSNLPWDSAMLGHDTVFSSLSQWLRDTIRFFSQRPHAFFIVRIHPGEKLLGTGQPVKEIIRQEIPQLPSHIRLVRPEDPINTYDLMALCHFGTTYTSITGLEMAMRGIPVVVAARPHYSQKGFTRDASSVEEYFRLLDEFLKKPAPFRLSKEEVTLAWRYGYLFYFRWAKPFPWHRSTFWQDIERWPIGKVLSEEGMSRFGNPFDLLADRAPAPVESSPLLSGISR